MKNNDIIKFLRTYNFDYFLFFLDVYDYYLYFFSKLLKMYKQVYTKVKLNITSL